MGEILSQVSQVKAFRDLGGGPRVSSERSGVVDALVWKGEAVLLLEDVPQEVQSGFIVAGTTRPAAVQGRAASLGHHRGLDPHIRVLLDRLDAGDRTWFRTRYRSGGLAWLGSALGADGYAELGVRVKRGDLGWLGEELDEIGLEALNSTVRPSSVDPTPRRADGRSVFSRLRWRAQR